MRTFISIALLMLGVGCAEAHQKAAAPKKLYFAVEVHREGKLVGAPKLLGEDGTRLRAQRTTPGAKVPDYRLTLHPAWQGDRYRIDLDVAVPGARGHRELSLLHGEVRKLELGARPGELAVWLTLMEVDSPEFRTLMELADDPEAGSAGSI